MSLNGGLLEGTGGNIRKGFTWYLMKKSNLCGKGNWVSCNSAVSSLKFIQQWRFKLRMSGLWHHVVWNVGVSISEKHTVSVVRVMVCNIFLFLEWTRVQYGAQNKLYVCIIWCMNTGSL
jgi:hypothetical protein